MNRINGSGNSGPVSERNFSFSIFRNAFVVHQRHVFLQASIQKWHICWLRFDRVREENRGRICDYRINWNLLDAKNDVTAG